MLLAVQFITGTSLWIACSVLKNQNQMNAIVGLCGQIWNPNYYLWNFNYWLGFFGKTLQKTMNWIMYDVSSVFVRVSTLCAIKKCQISQRVSKLTKWARTMLSYYYILICCLVRAVSVSYGRKTMLMSILRPKNKKLLLQWRWHHNGSAETCFPFLLYLCLRGLYFCETPLELCKYENATGASIRVSNKKNIVKCQCCSNKAEEVYITIIKPLSAYKSPRQPKTPAGLTGPDIWYKVTYVLDIKSSWLQCAAVWELAEFLGETFEVPFGFLKILVLLIVCGRRERESVLDPDHRGEQHHRHLTAQPESPCQNRMRHQWQVQRNYVQYIWTLLISSSSEWCSSPVWLHLTSQIGPST